ncbi:MAG: hypothetical protein NVS9B6_03540 [Candidatus Limnocylindrales bacterium]
MTEITEPSGPSDQGTAAEPAPSLDTRRALTYSAGSIGAGAFFAFNNFVLPQLLKAAGAGDLLTGLLSSTRSIEGVLIQPAVGALSDRTRGRLGRRRPFIAVAIPISAALFLFASAQQGLIGLAIGIVLFSIFFNIAADPYVALLADITRSVDRSLLSGISNGIQLLSQVAFLLAVSLTAGGGTGIPGWTYGAVAGLLVLTFGITVLGIREKAAAATPRVRGPGWRAGVGALTEHREAMRYLAAIFAYMVGFSAVLPYLTLFIVSDIHQSEQTALLLAAATLVVTAVAAIVFGRLAARTGPKSVLIAGWLLIFVASLGGLVIRDLPETILVILIAGVGNGAATAVGWPLLTALIPPAATGTFAGLKAAAESIAIPASVFIAAELFLPRFSYRGVFALLALAVVVALFILIRYVPVPRLSRPAPSMD